MKLIIDIPEMAYEAYKEWHKNKVATAEQSLIANGIPYEERPQGEWIEESSETGAVGIKYTWYRCNQCGWDNSLIITRNFCPNCGADMRGEKDERNR